jgi:hypothetical protein
MVNKRCAPRTMHCTWCGLVRTGELWVSERRKGQPGTYSDVICKRCKVFYFGGFDLDRFMVEGKHRAE